MLPFDPILLQVAEDPRSPWVLPGAAIFVIVFARWFFFRKNRKRPVVVESSAASPAPAEESVGSLSEPPPAALSQASTIPGTNLRYLTFSQPPMARYAMATSCYTPQLNATLAAVLSQENADVFMILAADETTVYIQNREYSGQFPRVPLREISLRPILPAKGSGMVSLYFESLEDGQPMSREFMACPVYSPELQEWCLQRAHEVSALLRLPVKTAPASHDC